MGVSPVVLVGNDESPVRRQAAMELYDPWSVGAAQVVGLEHQVISLRDYRTAGSFEERVVVRGEDVRPRKFKQLRMER